MKSSSCFEEGEFIILLLTLTQTSNKILVYVKHGKGYKSNYFDTIVKKSRRFTLYSIQIKSSIFLVLKIETRRIKTDSDTKWWTGLICFRIEYSRVPF